MGIFRKRQKDNSQRDLYSAVPYVKRDGTLIYPDPSRIAPSVPDNTEWSGKLADCE